MPCLLLMCACMWHAINTLAARVLHDQRESADEHTSEV